jgi:hypothetical protein
MAVGHVREWESGSGICGAPLVVEAYGAVVRTPKGDIRPFYGTWELSSGTQYAHCFWIGTRE